MATRSDLGTSAAPIFAAEDVSIVFTVYNAAGAVQNVTGWTFTFAAGSVLEYSGDGVALTDPENGVVTVDLTSADTGGLYTSAESTARSTQRGGRTVDLGITAFKFRRTDEGANRVLAYGTITIEA